jgi:hypothetical protein
MLEKPHLSVKLACGGVHRAQRLPAARASVGAGNVTGGQVGNSLDGVLRCMWAPTEWRYLQGGNSGTSSPQGGKFENHARGGEIWAVRREEGSERDGAGRRMLAAATATYGYLTPHCRRRTRPRLPPSASLPDLSRSLAASCFAVWIVSNLVRIFCTTLVIEF